MTLKITKLLVANRGEIACRIFRTCDELGIATVAVYSDADAKAKHVREANETVHIGAAPASESYLNQAAILAAAKETGADAVHPGYGFLSENAGFAEAVRKAGLIWVGPSPEATRAMGLKDEAKRIAEEAGVPVLPGYRGAAQDLKTLTEAAKTVGYPLLIKAVAGGGGRGIRLVTKQADLKAELESAVREAESSFSDGRVMLEKLVERPRHIEVQVFGDSHGNAVHLFERDCSLQRRRQKVIEEAPAPNMPEDVRAAMCAAAVKLAKAVKYEGAGTVEFIVDGTRPLALDTFWFLEMNTRLQVEHPVTEMITGLDLVEWQLRVAGGEKLPKTQSEIKMSGHAIEARICAEDPSHGFRPGTGKITALDTSSLGHRADFGFEEGDRIPGNYDSMIGKIIVHEPSRAGAIASLVSALEHFAIEGVPSNTGFVRRCILLRDFHKGTHHVNLIGELGDQLAKPPPETLERARKIAANKAIFGGRLPSRSQRSGPWVQGDGFRLNAPPRISVVLQDDGASETVLLDDQPKSSPLRRLMTRVSATVEGETFEFRIPDYADDVAALAGGDFVKASMPGKLIAVNVKAGDAVTRGQSLAVLEAMKMEHQLAAPRDGVVEAVPLAAGQQVAEGALIVALVAEGKPSA